MTGKLKVHELPRFKTVSDGKLDQLRYIIVFSMMFGMLLVKTGLEPPRKSVK